ncbi:ATPase/DNA packaging protein [Micromonospora sp. NPDC020750]|uniref:ATPase/DNA packaging protein n=1 Tax=unclassified Micromonospora TaxID=2617518 RepID=UPI0037891566
MAKTTTRMPRNAGYDGVPSVHTVKVPLWPYLVTPISSVGLAVGTGLAHWRWGDNPTAIGAAAAGLTLAGTALTGLTWRAAAARGIVRRAVATTTCVAGSIWAIGATIAAPWSSPWLDMWLLGMPTASIAMAVVRLMRSGPAGETGEGAEPGGGLAEAVKSLRGARLGRTQIVGAKAAMPVRMEPGKPISELAGDRESLASALDVAPTAVRVIADPDSAQRGRVEVVPVDQLRTAKPWPGLSAPGESIAAPIELGVMEDGEPLLIWLPGDHAAARNAAHYLVVGMSGAGKTELLLTLAAEVLSRYDAELWFGDPRKGPQLPEWLRCGATRIATTEDEVEDMLDALHQDVARRAKWLGDRKFKQWTPEAGRQGLRYRVAVIDEAAQVSAGNKTITDLTEECRSVGISLLFGLQRASYDRFPTSARANIAGSLCLGVESADDAEMALAERTLRAGAAPWEWKTDRPGCLYAEVPGTDPARWVMPGRTYLVDEADRAAMVARYRPTSTAPTSTVPAPRREDQGVTPQQPTPPADEGDERELNAALDLTDPPDDVDPSQPIEIPADMPRLAFGQLRTPPMGADEARTWMRDYLLRLHAKGHTQVSPGDLGDVMEATGKGTSWVGKELRRMSSGPDAVLQRTEHGIYKIRVPEPV